MTMTATRPNPYPTVTPRGDEMRRHGDGHHTLDVVIPVYNEVSDLEPCVRRLHRYLRQELPVTALITIADNASTDGTDQVARRLADELPGVRVLRLERKGRGRALQAAWTSSEATILAYMDVDLSTDLAALHPLVAPLLSGHSDIAIGTRLTHSSRVVRGPKRELISRTYNAILHATLRTRFSDAQCGFKAIRQDRAKLLLPQIQDNDWFFDTELLVLAERSGLRIHEVPVDWTDDPDSRVDIVSTAIADLKGIVRMSHQGIRFALIGVISTAAYLLLYITLRTGLSALLANLIALLVTAVANTAANRRLTFGVRDRPGALKHQAQGLGVFAVAVALTTLSLSALHLADPHPTRLVEASVLVAANLGATVLRFVLLRGWVFRVASGSQETHRR